VFKKCHATKKCQCHATKNIGVPKGLLGGAVASWLVHSTPDRAAWVRDLAGDIALCSWARHLTLTVPLFTQVNAGVNPVMDYHPIQERVEILLVPSC